MVRGTVRNIDLNRGPGPTTVTLGGPRLRWDLAGGVCGVTHRKGQRKICGAVLTELDPRRAHVAD